MQLPIVVPHCGSHMYGRTEVVTLPGDEEPPSTQTLLPWNGSRTNASTTLTCTACNTTMPADRVTANMVDGFDRFEWYVCVDTEACRARMEGSPKTQGVSVADAEAVNRLAMRVGELERWRAAVVGGAAPVSASAVAGVLAETPATIAPAADPRDQAHVMARIGTVGHTLMRGDARAIPMDDNSVDLIVTSPPYWAQRSYTDGGEHYDGQIGAEPTFAEFVDNLIACTRDWVRVLKPSGSIWVNLGDKYAGGGGQWAGDTRTDALRTNRRVVGAVKSGVPGKSLLGLPWRYALRCIDELGLILREEVIWAKPNGMPESVTDRCRRSHEQWFHFTKSPTYYSAVDRIRLQNTPGSHSRGPNTFNPDRNDNGRAATIPTNTNGSLPPSVWEVATAGLVVPESVGVDHYAAFPMELPRRIIHGWSPQNVCTKCGEGRRPYTVRSNHTGPPKPYAQRQADERGWVGGPTSTIGKPTRARSVVGEVCACTPYTDHAGTPVERIGDPLAAPPGSDPRQGNSSLGSLPRAGAWREYHLDSWQDPAPTTPGVVLDPFGGTGTTALVAEMYGRHGVHLDLSGDYLKIAEWRTNDPAQRAAALEVPKPQPQMVGQLDMMDILNATP